MHRKQVPVDAAKQPRKLPDFHPASSQLISVDNLEGVYRITCNQVTYNILLTQYNTFAFLVVPAERGLSKKVREQDASIYYISN